jgi:hypothetical protein
MLDTVSRGSSRIVNLVNELVIIKQCGNLGVRLTRLKFHPLVNLWWVLVLVLVLLEHSSNLHVSFIRVLQEIRIHLVECISNYCSHRQCTDTFQHLVKTFSQVACHMTIPPSSLIICSCPLRHILNVPIEKLETSRIEFFVSKQSVVQVCETSVRVS